MNNLHPGWNGRIEGTRVVLIRLTPKYQVLDFSNVIILVTDEGERNGFWVSQQGNQTNLLYPNNPCKGPFVTFEAAEAFFMLQFTLSTNEGKVSDGGMPEGTYGNGY